jgi:peptide/nickel transport system substrate-binding protein
LAVIGTAACGAGPTAAGGADPSPTTPASVTGPPVRSATPGGTARVALPAGAVPDYIWPYMPAPRAGQVNAEGFQELMYRPLYLFGGDDDTTVTVNYPLSPAHAPVYSDGGKTVTITLKGWKWSDGEPVDASDVIFWLNLMAAEPTGFYGYVPGELPDNLASYRAVSADTVVLQLKSAVSHTWFTYNQLAEITPMPAAWDVTAPGATAGSGGCATDSAEDNWARCAAVYAFLSGQAADTAGYAGNPLWAVVDGPWKLSAFTGADTGKVASFTPNPGYSGGRRPELSAVTYYAYPSAAAEYTALRAGRLDVGYVPSQDLPAVPAGQPWQAVPAGQPLPTATATATAVPVSSPLSSAYTLSQAYAGGIANVQLNYRSAALGPAYRQLYLRQALQELISRAGMIDALDNGYGYSLSGIVPAAPVNQWVPPDQNANGGAGPYPFSDQTADATLSGHGWQVAGGILTCESPGAGASHCGAGVKAGTRLSMSLEYPAGNAALRQEAALVKADFAQDGIRLDVVAGQASADGAQSEPCPPGQPDCGWDLMLSPGGWHAGGPGFEPTGEQQFETGGQLNVGGFSDPVLDGYLGLVRTSGSLDTFLQYAGYVAGQVPFLWLPASYTVAATKTSLAHVGLSPLGTLLPEYWFFTR